MFSSCFTDLVCFFFLIFIYNYENAGRALQVHNAIVNRFMNIINKKKYNRRLFREREKEKSPAMLYKVSYSYRIVLHVYHRDHNDVLAGRCIITKG